MEIATPKTGAFRPGGLLLLSWLLIGLSATSSSAADAPAKRLGNLVMNGGFEQDWFHFAFTDRRRFLLLQCSDAGMGEADGQIDYWFLKGPTGPEAWDSSVAHSGERSLRFDKAGSARHLVRFVGETNPKGGGAFYAFFKKPLPLMADQVARRAIVVGAWCKTKEAAGAAPQLTIDADGPKASVSFSWGTHDWEYREARIEQDQLTAAPLFVTITVSAGGGGVAWFDDVTCEEEPTSPLESLLSDGLSPSKPKPPGGIAPQTPPRAEPVNRLAHAGFEALDAQGWAEGWKRPALWTWIPNTYYAFTGWSHFNSKTFRGDAAVDSLVAKQGNHSLRFTVFPGDNFAVESEPIVIKQRETRPIEIRAWVKADNLRTLEIMGLDDRGNWIPQGNFLGDGMQDGGTNYNMASTGCGTYDWLCVRKFLMPKTPVTSLTLWICSRGFDGRLVPDKNIVGTLWIDDVQVLEHGAAESELSPTGSVPVQPPAASAAYPFRVREIDLGDRLWGKNKLALRLSFPGNELARVRDTRLQLTLTNPAGQSREFSGGARIIAEPPSPDGLGMAVAEAEYRLDSFCANSHEQYKLSLRLIVPGGQSPTADFWFGTPRGLLSAGVGDMYAYPEETLPVYANLYVSRDSFADLARCEVVVTREGKESNVLDLRDFARLLKPQTAPGYINTRNMLLANLESNGFAVQPWDEPQLDNSLRFRLYDKHGSGEKLLAESAAVQFGFIAHGPPAELPDRIERTAINERGFITVNGRPYFPVYFRPHMDSPSPESNYHVATQGCKALDVTKVLQLNTRTTPPDDAVKQELLALVSRVKDDPRFFQYEIGEGEMQLQGPHWRQQADWCRTAIDWIREADPNHLINGPISWLVGHPGHDDVMQAFVPAWDVVGVELSFESRAKIDKLAKPLMQNRKTAVIVGLEAYFNQPKEVLRWRSYRAVLDGAAGIGLCPSGMLEARPDLVNYLRGLNVEFRGLAPVIMGEEPREKISANSPLVDIMERIHDGRRYVLAVRNVDDQPTAVVRFTLPATVRGGRVKVRFENRSIPVNGDNFEDEFKTPRSVHVYELAVEKSRTPNQGSEIK